MQAIKVQQRVTEKGIVIPLDRVQEFKDRDVEIIILPVDSIDEKSGSCEFTFYSSKKVRDFTREDAYSE